MVVVPEAVCGEGMLSTAERLLPDPEFAHLVPGKQTQRIMEIKLIVRKLNFKFRDVK